MHKAYRVRTLRIRHVSCADVGQAVELLLLAHCIEFQVRKLIA